MTATATATTVASNVTASTHLLEASDATCAYRRFGDGPGLPLLCLQHFTGTLDNWDPAVTDPLAAEREVMVAQQMALDRPWIFRRMILVGTAPRAGEDIMHVEKPRLGRYLAVPKLQGSAVLTKLLFELTESSQAAGEAFVRRLTQRKEDLDPPSGPNVAAAQMAAFREWERFTGTRFADLQRIPQPTLVVNGIHDEMNPPSSPHAGRHQGGLRLQSMPTQTATSDNRRREQARAPRTSCA